MTFPCINDMAERDHAQREGELAKRESYQQRLADEIKGDLAQDAGTFTELLFMTHEDCELADAVLLAVYKGELTVELVTQLRERGEALLQAEAWERAGQRMEDAA